MTREEEAIKALCKVTGTFEEVTNSPIVNDLLFPVHEILAAMLAFADAEAEAMRERAADRFQKAIEDGYSTPVDKVDQCEHGQSGWEDCIACYDVALLAAVDEVRNLPATGEV